MPVWDIRNFKAAVGAVGDLPNDEDRLDAVFSPDERYLLTGARSRRSPKGQTWSPDVGRVFVR